MAVLIYLVTNWFQQDYFSPQATAFVICTAILAALLWMVRAADVQPPAGSLATRVRRALVPGAGVSAS